MYGGDGYDTWADGSALAGSDFTSSSGTLVIPAGQTTGTISVPITNDTDNETDESFSVVLGTPTNATLADASGIATIFDNDTPSGSMPTVSIASAGLVSEGDGGALFTVTLSQAINKTVRVHYATNTTGTAVDGAHYYSVSRDLYFEPNQTSKQIGVELIDDLMYEGGSSAPYFFVTLSTPVNALVGTASGYAQIIDDDPLPTLSINDQEVTEGVENLAQFVVALTNPINVPIAVTVVVSPGTALRTSDYHAINAGTYQFTIPVGSTTTTRYPPGFGGARHSNTTSPSSGCSWSLAPPLSVKSQPKP